MNPLAGLKLPMCVPMYLVLSTSTLSETIQETHEDLDTLHIAFAPSLLQVESCQFLAVFLWVFLWFGSSRLNHPQPWKDFTIHPAH